MESTKKPHKGRKFKVSTADFEDRIIEFIKKSEIDPKWAEAVILKIIENLKSRSNLPKIDPDYLSTGSIKNYYFALQSLLEMNDIELPWKRIRRSVPRQHLENSKAWERKEIQTMLQHGSIEDRVLITMASSSGIRAGSFDLQW